MWKHNTPLARVAISSIAVFLIACFTTLLLRQGAVLAVGSWQYVDHWGRTSLVFVMPAVLYVLIPWMAFRWEWFGIGRRAATDWQAES
jgi:hypothetical protein